MSPEFDRLKSALADRYTIERELGEGGMATVYLGRDLKHNRDVALKVLKPDLAAVLGAERFLVEIETTANLQHPHILPLYDSGEADGFLYYVMPYVEGETLQDRLARQRRLPVEEALHIAREVADGLAYAHDHGIVHRDIKPSMFGQRHALKAFRASVGDEDSHLVRLLGKSIPVILPYLILLNPSGRGRFLLVDFLVGLLLGFLVDFMSGSSNALWKASLSSLSSRSSILALSSRV